MEEMVIRPLYHEHTLFLKENVSKEVDCYGCGNPLADLEMAYVCIELDCSSINRRIILHKKCGELPSQIVRHPKHPGHPLHLFDFHRFKGHLCDVCRRHLDTVLGYRCSSCDFDVDIACEKVGIDALLGEKKELPHPSHPHHPLTLMRKPALAFYCDGCGAQDVDMAYICSTCDFMVHKSCASLPLIILPTDHHHHHHRLFLAFSFPKKHLKYDYKCEVCEKLLDRTCWLYYCGDCRYFVHIKCVGSTTTPYSNLIEDGGSDAIEFPLYAEEISNKLITPFVMRETGVDRIPVPIPDSLSTSNSFIFKYHHHPLSLVWEAGGDDELKICDACVTPISSPPYYQCTASACPYLIHSVCSLLPNTLHSSSSNPNSQLYGHCKGIHDKNHNFTLYATSESKGKDAISYWNCDLCNYFAPNGMGYKCEECGMKIDVKCVSLPTTMRHSSHPHHKQLVLTRLPLQEEMKECHVCDNICNIIAYCCSEDDCDFALDLKCVLLPKSIREREWDKHPLLLTSDASLDHSSDFFCEFCETELHPKSWMYHCRQCDVSFHLSCLDTKSGAYRNIKVGRRYELDWIHPNHPLTFTYITLKRRCDVCDDDVYTWLGLECASCYYAVCIKCGAAELEKR